MEKALKHSCLIPCIGFLCCVLATGCGGRSFEPASGASASKILSTSRVILPASGGQTIQAPAATTAEAYALWSPLNEAEKKLPRRMDVLPAAVLRSDFAWLPPAETEVMQSYLYRLTHNRRDLAARVLGKAEDHLPIILAALRARGLPTELACLPMVESAFEPRAVSPAGAAGLWQLMPETARRFGLTVNAETDERFDVRKSTAAATAYLATLHSMFNDWPLALAAYNCGEGAMKRALAGTNTETLPELTSACRNMAGARSPLAEETLRFVPQFAAAVQIMANSNAWGFTSRAMLHLEPQAAPLQSKESSLVLIGRYDSATEYEAAPARSRRIE